MPRPHPVIKPTPQATAPGHQTDPRGLYQPTPLQPSRLATIAEVVLVTLRNSTDIAVRDISNFSKPVTRCLINDPVLQVFGPTLLRFVNSTHISYLVQGADGSTAAMYLVDLQTRKASVVPGVKATQGMVDYAWSPDGSTLIYAIPNAAGTLLWCTQVRRAGPVLASVPPIPAVEVR